MENKQDILKKVKERICKRDSSLKLRFNPEQFIIGSHVLKLEKNSPVSIEVNTHGKLAVRFIMAPNNDFGFIRRDVGIAFDRLTSLVAASEEREHPLKIALELPKSCFLKMCQVQPGMEKVITDGLKYNMNLAKYMTFIMAPWNEQVGSYLKAQFVDEQGKREYEFDSDEAISFLKNEVAAVWAQMNKEKREVRPGLLLNKEILVNIVTHTKFDQILHDLNLTKTLNKRTGKFEYKRAPYMFQRDIGLNKEEYKSGFKARIPTDKNHINIKEVKDLKRRYVTDNSDYKVVRTKEEVWIRASSEPYSKKILYNGVSISSEVSYQSIQHHNQESENENVMRKQKSEDELMDTEYFQPLQAMNGQIYINGDSSVDQVTEGMRHLGDDDDSEIILDTPPPSQQNIDNEYHQGDASFSMDTSEYHSRRSAPFQGAAQTPQQEVANGANNSQKKDRKKTAKDTKVLSPGDETMVVVETERDGAFNLLVKDTRTIDRKEFVNDSIMGFMLHHIRYRMFNKERLERLVLWNTFFYSNLARDITPLGFSSRVPHSAKDEEMLLSNISRLIRWSKKFDIFEKDLVIPVNEDFHWLVMAVINPRGAIVDMDNEEESRKAPKCYILFYDPLSGLDPTKRNHMTYMARKYLEVVFEHTKAPGKKFYDGRNTIYDDSRAIVMRPKNAPIQNNFTDCGLYALHFIEGLFCGIDRPVSVEDFPEFDWSELWPEGEKMCELMRDKVYNLIRAKSTPKGRSRLEQFERKHRCGLSREGATRKTRRHSAAQLRRTRRDDNYYLRHYSMNPPHLPRRVLNDEPLFTNPRNIAKMPITERVRKLAYPENNFPVAY